MPSSQHDPLIGQVIADRYQILELVGEGGMGRVYLAEHVRIGRKSAVKVMSPNLALSADAVSRFNREAANAASINHPNVAQIYDFGETPAGLLYLAMEFVEGQTLRSLIEQDGPLPLDRAADIARQIADALAAAHHLGIVHRDLKPDNVMIATHHDGTDWVKVVDFGIAKTVQGSGDGADAGGSQTVTTAGVSLGTPEYMSPEQLAGERLDSRTDLYSLGLVLFNMLTGDLPYPRVTSRETLVRRLTARPHTLAEIAPRGTWPDGLQDALDRALAPDPKDRYESVVDFARDVTAVLARFDGDRTMGVTPPVATRRIREPRSANRKSLIVAACALVVLAVGVGALVAYRGRPIATPAAARTPAVPSASVAQVVKLPNPVLPALPKPERVVFVKGDPKVKYVDSTALQVPHAWLRANGDSGAVQPLSPNATDAERIRYLVQEIRGHAARAVRYRRSGSVSAARAEMRDLSSEVKTFRALYPSAADSVHIEQFLQGPMRAREGRQGRQGNGFPRPGRP